MQEFISRVKENLHSVNGKNTKVIVSLVILTLALPVTLFVVQNQQDIRQQASTNQATIVLSQDNVPAGESIAVEWELSASGAGNLSPTVIATNTPTVEPTTTSTTSANTACPPYTVTDFPATENGTQRLFRLDIPSGNAITKIQIADNGTPLPTYSILALKPGETENQIATQTFQEPTTVTISPETSTIYITLKKRSLENNTDSDMHITSTITDACGNHPAAFSVSLGSVLGRAPSSHNSFALIPKAYAQTTITGAETLQLYSIPAANDSAAVTDPIGFPLYLNCIPKQESATGPVKNPPADPVMKGTCQYQIPATTKSGSYMFRMLAADGQTILGESAVFKVSSVEEEKNCVQGQTFAQDSFGTACRSFNNSCDIPADWTTVPNCPTKANKRSALPTIPGDLNYDDRIDLPDFSIMLNCLKRGKSCTARKIPADLNGDNQINQADFDVLIKNYEQFKQSSQSAAPVNQPNLKPGNSGVNKQPFPRKGR